MKKKIGIGIGISLCLLIALGIITYCMDKYRVTIGCEPKYCIKIVNQGGNQVTYWGLGYKVIRYVGVSPKEPYENNIGVKIGSWFMKYQLPSDDDKIQKQGIQTLDDFYHHDLTKGKDIRNLEKEYCSFDAQKDNCFVIGAMVHNDYLYEEFMTDYKKKTSSFIRVAQNTVEGDLILYDILYDEKLDKLYLVNDSTRDQFAEKEDRKIVLKEYEHIGSYQYKDHLYWVLFHEDITQENFQTDNVFVITKIQ